MNDPGGPVPRLEGLVPESLAVRSVRIHLDSLELKADIGFHEFEVGAPQRLILNVEVWIDETSRPVDDDPAGAWNYDHLKREIERIAASRRFNLQETLVAEIYRWIAGRHGVSALRVRSSKPDVYVNAGGVGVEFASFSGACP